jgi:hypothetical protein
MIRLAGAGVGVCAGGRGGSKMGQAIAAFLDDLLAGDPVALGFAGGFVALGLIAALIIWIVKRQLAADDEKWKNRRKKKADPGQ